MKVVQFQVVTLENGGQVTWVLMGDGSLYYSNPTTDGGNWQKVETPQIEVGIDEIAL